MLEEFRIPHWSSRPCNRRMMNECAAVEWGVPCSTLGGNSISVAHTACNASSLLHAAGSSPDAPLLRVVLQRWSGMLHQAHWDRVA
jgi:hypothetical protein